MAALPTIYTTVPNLQPGQESFTESFVNDAGTTVIRSYTLNDVPTTFESMDTLNVEGVIDAVSLTDDIMRASVRITESGTGTILAAQDAAGAFRIIFSPASSTSPTPYGPITFDYVNTTATAAQWNNAVAEVEQFYDTNMGNDSGYIRLYDLYFNGTFTGPLGASNSVIKSSSEPVGILSAHISSPADNSTQDVTQPLSLTLSHSGDIAAADWYAAGLWSFINVDENDPSVGYFPPDGSADGSQPGDPSYPNANYSEAYGPPDGIDFVWSGGIRIRMMFGDQSLIGLNDPSLFFGFPDGTYSFIAHDIWNFYSDGTFAYGPGGLFENRTIIEARLTTVGQGNVTTDRPFNVTFTSDIPSPRCVYIYMIPGSGFGGDSIIDAVEFSGAVEAETIDSWSLQRDHGSTPWWNNAQQQWQAVEVINTAFVSPTIVSFPANGWDTGGAFTVFSFTVNKGTFSTTDQLTILNDGIIGTLLTVGESSHLHTSDSLTVIPQLPDTVFPNGSNHVVQSDEVGFTNQMVGQDSVIIHTSDTVSTTGVVPQIVIACNTTNSRFDRVDQAGAILGNYAFSNPEGSNAFEGFGLRPDTNIAYLTNPNIGFGRTLYLYNVESGVRLGTLPTSGASGQFYGCAFDHKRQLWVWDGGSTKNFYRINIGTGAAEETVETGGLGLTTTFASNAFAFDHIGNIWVFDGVSTDKIQQRAWPSYELKREWNYTSPSGTNYSAINFHRSGRMWILHEPSVNNTTLREYDQNTGTILNEYFIELGSGTEVYRPSNSVFYPSSFDGLYSETNQCVHAHRATEPILFVGGTITPEDSVHVVQSDEASVGRFEVSPGDGVHGHVAGASSLANFLPGPSIIGFIDSSGGNPGYTLWYDRDTATSVYQTPDDHANLPINTQRIAVDINGDMWGVTYSGTLYRYDPMDPTYTIYQVEIADAGVAGFPNGIAFDPVTNNCWVTYYEANANSSLPDLCNLIEVNTATGALITNTNIPDIGPTGLAITYEGEFWIADGDSNSANGRGIQVITNPGTGAIVATITLNTASPQLSSLFLLPNGFVGCLERNLDNFYEIETATRTITSSTAITFMASALSWSEHPVAAGTIMGNDSSHTMQSDEVTLIPSFLTFNPTASVTGRAFTVADLSVSVVYGESYCNLAMDFQNVSLSVSTPFDDVIEIGTDPVTGDGRTVAPRSMATISFDMRKPFLLQGQPYHPVCEAVVTTDSTGVGAAIAPEAPETYNATATLPTQRWIVKAASISGGDGGGAKFNYITTWTPESGNAAWGFTSPGYPYRPFFGSFQYGGDNRPYKMLWNNTLSFAGQYDEFMQLNQTIAQPATFVIVCWQVKLNGTAPYYPVFNRFPVDVSSEGFAATVDPDFGYRVNERGTQEFTAGSAVEFSGGKDFRDEAIYTLVFNGATSTYRYRDHDRKVSKSVSAGGSSTNGMIIGGSPDPNFLMFVPEVLYFNTALPADQIASWETHLFNKYSIGNLAKE